MGLDDSGEAVVCEGPAGRFRIPINDTLRKAVSGELKASTLVVEPGAELTPREIQARIRAGATIIEVAELTGAPADRIKRFAGPVLLERTRAAEMAKLAHPVRGDGPMHTALADLILEALTERGHADTTEWDAYKGADNRWMVRISWTVGRTENSARFVFAPGGGGGTATPADATARDLLDPDARRALRSVDRSLAFSGVDDEIGDESEPEPPVRRTPRLRSTAPSTGRPIQSAGVPIQPGAQRPEIPSWEDVLLGVRGHGNS